MRGGLSYDAWRAIVIGERTKSIVVAISVGVGLGAIALAARYAPVGALSHGPADGTVDAGSASAGSAVDLGSAPADRTALTFPVAAPPIADREPTGPPDRFTDPAARAACLAGMALVDGDFCPALPYHCTRRGGDEGFGCPEYERGARCLEAVDHRRFCIDRHEWPNRVGELPRVYVDWYEAKALCAAAGKRLCRRSEWILACEGPKRLPYPWGFVRSPSPCNIDRAAIEFDISAMIGEATREEELARLWQADPIGSHPACVSAFGAYDQSGNVDEWTDNLADDPGTPHPSTLNGGYWGPVRDTCRLTTTGHGPEFRFYQVGFRCCADTIDGVPVPPPRLFIERDRKEAAGTEPASQGRGGDGG